ncbi:hypothetical protein EV383_0323 [Pseudonocardia sediminis]|uniref:Uncharacterized protein n=1 Tax=Pseudonocardia sediminis TaxID=1397368 RepID=A0A4Q7URV9_PSEST|nr:hypothetical protein EV383_0323 [Pseudonocardia sediminis]
MSEPDSPTATAPPERARRSPGALARLGAGALVRLVLVLACFALVAYTVDLLLIDDPSLVSVLIWFAGALFLHDLVLFPLYAGGDRVLALVLKALPRTRVPLVNHIRIPVLGAGLSLLMFLPGIIQQGGATTLAATGLDQEPYRERWVWLTVALFAISLVIWLLRTLVASIRARSPRHREQVVDGEREDGLRDQPAADLPVREQPAHQHEPDPER